MWLTLLLWNRLDLKAGATDNPLLLQLVNSRTRTGNREQFQRWTTGYLELLQGWRDLILETWHGNWRRELTSIGPSGSEVKLELQNWPKRVPRTCRAVLDLPGQKSNWNWRSRLRAKRAKKKKSDSLDFLLR